MPTSVRAFLRGIRCVLAARPRVADVAFGMGATGWYLAMRLDISIRYDEALPDTPGGMLLLLGLMILTTLPLTWRRSRPWTVLGVVGAAHVATRLADPPSDLSIGSLFVLMAVYAVGRHASPPRSVAAAGVGAVVMLVTDLRQPGFRLALTDVVTVFGLFGVVWLLGSGQRRIRADAARLLALTNQLRAEQHRSMQRAVVAERARIARDLHDVVAHHVSAIAVQARAIDTAGQDDPHLDDSRLVAEGVRDIRQAARTALAEMRRTVGLLADHDREGDQAGGPPPEPSLGHLDQLTQAARAAGCHVEVAADGLTEAGALSLVPPAVQVSAYRIAQEALTNAVKHAGPTWVRLELAIQDGVLRVTVDNGPPDPAHTPMPGSGLGLIGMRERAAVCGGALRAGARTGGGWLVRATLPIPPQPATAETQEAAR